MFLGAFCAVLIYADFFSADDVIVWFVALIFIAKVDCLVVVTDYNFMLKHFWSQFMSLNFSNVCYQAVLNERVRASWREECMHTLPKGRDKKIYISWYSVIPSHVTQYLVSMSERDIFKSDFCSILDIFFYGLIICF